MARHPSERWAKFATPHSNDHIRFGQAALGRRVLGLSAQRKRTIKSPGATDDLDWGTVDSIQGVHLPSPPVEVNSDQLRSMRAGPPYRDPSAASQSIPRFLELKANTHLYRDWIERGDDSLVVAGPQ